MPSPLSLPVALLALSTVAPALAADFKGDLGLGAFSKSSHVRGRSDQVSLLPYGYATWGPAFWRVNTFGVGTLPFGSGRLEFVAKLDLENAQGPDCDLNSLLHGKNAVPLGLGTLQTFRWGALFLHAYQDAGASRGQLAELRYAGRLGSGRGKLYPQAALEWRSAAFNQAYYGVEAGDPQGLPAYRAGASLNPTLALAGEWALSPRWVLNAQFRRKWLDPAVADSPRVSGRRIDDGHLALCWRFN